MMAGPLVGGDRGIGWVRAIVGAFVLCLVVQYLVGKLLPEVLASVIAWGAFALVMVAVWRINSRAGRNELLGSARFGSRDDVRGLESGDGDLLIGRSAKSGKLLRYGGPAHLLTMAPTRSGKGVGTIIPNLLILDRSVICIDPKGENARVTARARAAKGKVWCLDPFEVSGQPPARYNPLDRLDPASLDLAEDAMTLADALVPDPAGQGGEAHWNEEAKALIAGLILYAVVHEDREHRTLATVRDYLTLAPKGFADLLTLMQDSRGAGGLIARAANRQLGKSDREAAGVLSSAQRHTHFLDSPRIVASTSASDFTFAGLKEGVSTVFLCLPPDRLDAYSRWLRLLVAQALTDMARSPIKPARPVLFLLDEFAALGRLEPVERAMGLMAGYGLQLWPILQDMHQLRALYGERAGTFMSNAGVFQAFGVNDLATAELLSKTLGQETLEYQTAGYSQGSRIGGAKLTQSASTHINARNLMNPDEIMRMSPTDQLLMLQGQAPLIVEKIRYYDQREFAGLADPG
ncbi:type IV secretory system conjugative DNA transfer family protein [Sphingobium sp. AEW010]|uniref:type IV secretory system conjugative DNA transfer family protein n=1 Tax=unclassified Sphingobium TaxID=2611147 RepID=UPI00119ADA37|nr:type IV secretion system protein VirD4 [Sphingobium sp. AEW010]TWD17791.1 type IV secretion system protein VirD4 [Sphingobium sp. AEW013]TWD20049.1 type IV secretion system protein VirD4 [Sphingobium sp. AEW001]